MNKDELLEKGAELLTKVFKHFSQADVDIAVEIKNYQDEVEKAISSPNKEHETADPPKTKNENTSSTFPKNDDVFIKPEKDKEPKATQKDADDLWK